MQMVDDERKKYTVYPPRELLVLVHEFCFALACSSSSSWGRLLVDHCLPTGRGQGCHPRPGPVPWARTGTRYSELPNKARFPVLRILSVLVQDCASACVWVCPHLPGRPSLPGQASSMASTALFFILFPADFFPIFGLSLNNMYKELVDSVPGFTVPNHGYLMGWARQGLL